MKPLVVEYFQFEEDFMEDNIRCIPMITRFKLDACGIKVKLNEWSKMTTDERELLSTQPIETKEQLNVYANYLRALIQKHTGQEATPISSEKINTSWSLTEQLPSELQTKLDELKLKLTLDEWNSLSVLQRFALIKLTRPGHENRNFPKAMKEFGLV